MQNEKRKGKSEEREEQAGKTQTIVVTLTPEEVELIVNAVLTCPVQVSPRNMPAVLERVQSIIKKLRPPPLPAELPKED